MKGTKQAPSRFSLAILVRGAANSLSATLESVAELGVECLLAWSDEAEKDADLDLTRWKTRSVALPWHDDLAAARNACLKYGTGDHLVWLEPGERLTKQSLAVLREWLENPANRNSAGTLVVTADRSAGELAAEEVRAIRVVPLGRNLQYAGRVRESLDATLAAREVEVKAITAKVLRSAGEASWEGRVGYARRQLQLAHLEIEKEGPDCRLHNCLGESLAILGDRIGAEAAYRQSLANSKRGSRDMLEAYYGLIQLAESDPQSQTAIHLCIQALEIFPLDAQLLATMGGLLQGAGRLDLAVRSYQAAWRYGEVCESLWHMEGVREVAAVCCSLCRQLQGNDEEASWVLNEALSMFPGSLRLMRQRLELLIKNGRHDEALGTASQLSPSTHAQEPLRLAIRGACLAREKNWLASRRLLLLSYTDGCRELVCLRWLSLTHLALGDFVAARPILEEWREADPDSREAEGYLIAIETSSRLPGKETPESRAAEPSTSDKWFRVDSAVVPHSGPKSANVSSPAAK